MSREYSLRLEDILEAVRKILEFTRGHRDTYDLGEYLVALGPSALPAGLG